MTSTFTIDPKDYQDYFLEGDLVKIPRCVMLVAYIIFRRDERFFDLSHLEMQFEEAEYWCRANYLIDNHYSLRFPYGRVKK